MAILGLGTDIVEISRFSDMSEAALQRLAARVLTPVELQQFSAHKQPARFLAKRFAAKEAAAKALGTGIGRGVSLQSLGATSALLSIADELHYAVATVVLS